jgi:hypothetical protein
VLDLRSRRRLLTTNGLLGSWFDGLTTNGTDGLTTNGIDGLTTNGTDGRTMNGFRAMLIKWLPFVVSLSNHERTRAEIRSFPERVAMIFPRIALRFIHATPLIAVGVRSQAPFVVSAVEGFRTGSLKDLPRTEPAGKPRAKYPIGWFLR